MDLNNAQQWLSRFFDYIEEHKAYLSELDNPIGDGDHGHNMARGAKAAREALEATPPTSLEMMFKTVGMSLLSKVGGASGPLYGSVFLAFANQLKGQDEIKDPKTLFASGLEAIVRRGKASVGEKTMVDVWTPFTEKLNQAVSSEDIESMVLATKPLKATKGRAAYVGDRSIGHIDPGSYSSGLFFKAFIEAHH